MNYCDMSIEAIQRRRHLIHDTCVIAKYLIRDLDGIQSVFVRPFDLLLHMVLL